MGHGLGLAIGHGDSDSENLKKYQRRPLDRGALLCTSFQLGGSFNLSIQGIELIVRCVHVSHILICKRSNKMLAGGFQRKYDCAFHKTNNNELYAEKIFKNIFSLLCQNLFVIIWMSN